MLVKPGLNIPAPCPPDEVRGSSSASTLSQSSSNVPVLGPDRFAETSVNARGSPVTGHSATTVVRGTKSAKSVSYVVSPCASRFATLASVAA